MSIQIRKSISRKKWLAVLQVRGSADEILMQRMDEAEKLITDMAQPKTTYRIIPKADIRIEGKSIEKHLKGCHSVAVMALTLGAGIDALIRRTQVTDMAMAVIIDCGASVLTEQLADEYEKQISENISQNTGGFTTPRFSPGYGDYPIEIQKDIIGYVDGSRRIGLNVTSDFTMIPRKSVTALIGIADTPVTGHLATCDMCALRDKCELKKEGKFCGN